MGSNRKNFSDGVNLSLYAQVEGLCPRCLAPLQYDKAGRKYKAYEIAHIYPLNPNDDEKEILAGVECLNEDVNHEDNLIPLCTGCHTKFDKPRTVEDYYDLLRTKKDCINKALQRKLWGTYPIEDDVKEVIAALCSASSFDLDDDIYIDMNAKAIDSKISSDELLIFIKKIKRHVSEYYLFIKNQFVLADRIAPGVADAIAVQVKSFYFKQKMLGGGQQAIYRNIAEWIFVKSGKINFEAAEIMTSFFVQNCEVFE